MSTTTVIDHLAVRWRPLAAGLRDQARFDRLSRALAGGPLDAAIDAGTGRDEIVCVRAVEVPTMRVTADVTDDELLGRLAAAIATAVGTAVADISDQAACIRYRSRAHAALDLAVSLARGDRSREWAWRQLGLWPGSGEPAAAGERIAVALAEAPGPLPGLLSAAAGAGALGFLAGLLGPARLDAVVRAAWTARGRPLPGWDELLGSAAAPDEPDFAQVTTMLARGALGRELLRGAGLPPQSAAAASAAALLDAEPSLPLRPATGVMPLVTAAALVSLGRGRHDDRESGPAGSPWPREGQAPAVPWPPADETAPQPVTAPQPGSTCPAAETTADPAVTPARGVATQYGGLPYLLHLVGQSGLPERVADGELASTGLVPFLYEIGLRILGRLTDPGRDRRPRGRRAGPPWPGARPRGCRAGRVRSGARPRGCRAGRLRSGARPRGCRAGVLVRASAGSPLA